MNLNIRFMAVVAIFQASLAVFMFLDVTIMRQVVAFLYLVFVPGFVFVRTLKLRDLKTSENVFYSVGLSIALVMLIGLFANAVFPVFGINSPLSSLPLLTFINGLVLVMSLFVPKRQETDVAVTTHIRSRLLAATLFAIPVLSVAGSFFVSKSQNSSFLLFAIIIIAILVVLGCFWKILQTFHTLILSICTFSLVYMSIFFTRFVMLWDEAKGFYVFRLTQINHYWNPNFVPALEIDIWKLNGMASTTILPTAFSEIANIDGTMLFQILFPSLLILVPAVLYSVYRTQTDKRAAFLGAFLFVTNSVALGWGNDVQKVAQLFYSLLLLVIFTEKVNSLKKDMLFVIFTVALVISHYSLAYIFAATLFFVYLVQRLTGKNAISKIKVSYVLFALLTTFAWNVFVSGGAGFNALVQSSGYVEQSLFTNLFNIAERGGLVTQFLGASQNTTSTILNEISVNIFRLSTLLICLGFLSVILKKSEAKFDKEFSLILCFNIGILLLNVVLPGLASTFLMQRFYQTTLIVLSPLFVLGSDFIMQSLGALQKTKNKINTKRASGYFITALLIALFLFQSGFIYEVARTPSYSVSLSGYRINKIILYTQLGYTNGFDVASAKWLSTSTDHERTAIYGDINSIDGPLLSYGAISDRSTVELLNTTRYFRSQSLIYLNWVNLVSGVVTTTSYQWNLTDVHDVLDGQNTIYSSGGCATYSSLSN